MKVYDKLDKHSISEINEIVLNGGLLLWPSGGVYGILCNGFDKKAVDKIYEIKNRDYSKPLTLVSSIKTIDKYAYVDDMSKKTAEKFWPDFIGIICKKKDNVSDYVTSGKDTVGLVCSSEINKILAENIDVPLASTSANISGEPEITEFESAIEIFNGKADAVIKADKVQNNFLNTLICFENGKLKILREGKYTEKEILDLIFNK